MKRFRFSLDSVLNWRSVQADQEQFTLERLNAEQRTIEAASAHAQEEQRGTAGLLALSQAVDGMELQRLAGYRSHLTRKTGELERRREECLVSVSAQREKCVEAERRRKLLEKLEQKQHHQWRVRNDREADEAASDLFLAGWERDRS